MDDLKARVFRYKLAMSFAKRLFVEGFLTVEEYDCIDTIMTKKHGLSLDSIFREKALNPLDNIPFKS